MNTLDAIYTELPHAGAMRLLEQVQYWDQATVKCTTGSHRWPANPLRRSGVLPAVHAVEYAAQAAAVHGVLSAGLGDSPVLLLAAVQDLVLDIDRLDTLPAPLHVEARIEARVGVNAKYRFVVSSTGQPCVRGTLMLMQAGENCR